MSRTKVLNKTQIIQCAYNIAKEKGRKAITIREIGSRLGKSTAPIYTQFSSIDEIMEDLVVYFKDLLSTSTKQQSSGNKFLDIGVGFLSFVMENKLIFNDFFISTDGPRFDFTRDENFYLKQMKQSPFLSVLDDERLLRILEDMQIYTYGLAIMICANIGPSDDLSYYQKKLELSGNSLIGYHMYSSGKYELAIQNMVKKISEQVDIKEVY